MSMVVWTAVTVPLSVSYGMPHTTPWDVADYMMTVLFGIDLLINFRTAFYNFQVGCVLRGAPICKRAACVCRVSLCLRSGEESEVETRRGGVSWCLLSC